MSFLFRVIPSLFHHAAPVFFRLALVIVVFRFARFLLRQWRHLGRR